MIRGPKTIDNAIEKTGVPEPYIHEPIALAVAVTMRCDGCITVHTEKAAEHLTFPPPW